jgi:phage-related protein
MTNRNYKITESALSNLSPLEEKSQARSSSLTAIFALSNLKNAEEALKELKKNTMDGGLKEIGSQVQSLLKSLAVIKKRLDKVRKTQP